MRLILLFELRSALTMLEQEVGKEGVEQFFAIFLMLAFCIFLKGFFDRDLPRKSNSGGAPDHVRHLRYSSMVRYC